LRHELRLTPAGLPDCSAGSSDHSVSNHRRDDRGSPGCQRICARPDRLRHSVEGSPVHADRIEFTTAPASGNLRYGLVVLVSLLSTSHYCDAVTLQYPTTLRRRGADFHRSDPAPSQAHDRGPSRSAAAQLVEKLRNAPDHLDRATCCGRGPPALRWQWSRGAPVSAIKKTCCV